MFKAMSDALLRAMGWRSLLLHGDPCVLDRWLWLRRHTRAGSVRTFDAGCGNGAFSIYAARQGNDVVAASFSTRELDKARERAERVGGEGIEFRTLDLREIEQHRASLGHFDQVFCLETIEHMSDDEGLLRSLADMLEPGGRLLLTAPFDGHHALYSEARYPSGVEDGSHVRYGYSRQRLREILERAGFEIHEEDFISGLISQKLTNIMRRLTRRFGRGAAWLTIAPLRLLVIADRPLSRLLGYPRLSVAVVAEKKR
jgi:2-polyprenyl-3-methyl-5-hydroxy-6-metoxy-1,4-benzoquinol methylase